MKIIPLFIVTTAIALTSCDSKQEDARKDALENRADSLEEQAKATRNAAERKADVTEENKRTVDQQADAIRKDGERKADALENAADKTREQK